jgi:hypothetical protein
MELIFNIRYWTIHLTHLGDFVYLFGSIRGCPNIHKMAKKQKKKPVFWLFWTISLKRIGIMIGLGAFLSLNMGSYILPTCGPWFTFLGPFGGAQMAKNSIKTCYLVVLDHLGTPIGPKKALKGPQLVRIYGPILSLKISP